MVKPIVDSRRSCEEREGTVVWRDSRGVLGGWMSSSRRWSPSLAQFSYRSPALRAFLLLEPCFRVFRRCMVLCRLAGSHQALSALVFLNDQGIFQVPTVHTGARQKLCNHLDCSLWLDQKRQILHSYLRLFHWIDELQSLTAGDGFRSAKSMATITTTKTITVPAASKLR